MVTFLLLLAAVVSASEDEAALTLTAAMSADDACLSATCSLKLIQLKAAAATAPSQDQEALILTAAEEQEDPNKFCSDRHEEGWHCDGKKRVHCEREGREWKANRKHECDRACRRGQCSNMLGQFSEQEAPAGPPTDPNKFCEDKKKDGWSCDGKKRVHCKKKHHKWEVAKKVDCEDKKEECHEGKCKKAKKP
ncbi:unnamed protein product [Polarella glacialis]|uniref:Uncharacterized protein n=1 Tax=Polarella glacialis TaxID=89957 RepID=A0A813K6V0_POLGL|nr:unnamed protein product [Polarella glacialis]|mmetsp:Transcript_3971/g.7647  ORF Transcript_3971/g.7647 Transcript_3971/m.7647 type:complete len:193 (+) Transcript_3971:160-738(+)|eukprot:CAMPEP_0115068660 /NCGR_PEP_ID=MMETSP0227-20121206/12106_1 /TAXON_ID=89957 /ORGANISM="Polarella glacialis, Strain CCMP 1383" /LENGTH=192 /DNA_ID=CAMNT_0002454937 /DNA_START=153 /DNA_END=731 /DNA_ORIENTATION=-